jgi:carboxylate-amine ligase
VKPISSWTAAEASVHRLRAAFDAAALSLTVGAEEEVMLVTADGTQLVAGVEDVLLRTGGDDRFRAEFRASQIELVTRPSLSAADVGRELAIARLDLRDALGPSWAAMACGAHPTATMLGPVTRGERYEALSHEHPWARRTMLTCGLHVHVGLAGADRALAVYNALRSYVPEFLALSCNSPFQGGERTGLASTRTQLNRSLARHGVPPAFADWAAYAELASWGHADGVIPDPSYHWWDVRLHPGYGTLEIRGCDTQTELTDTVAIVALAQALVAWLAERFDAGDPLPVHDGYRIAESLWLAALDRAAPELLDLDTGARIPLTERVAELLDVLAPTARELGTEQELARVRELARRRGAERQLEIASAVGVDELAARLTAHTTASAQRCLESVDVERPKPAPEREAVPALAVPAVALPAVGA